MRNSVETNIISMQQYLSRCLFAAFFLLNRYSMCLFIKIRIFFLIWPQILLCFSLSIYRKEICPPGYHHRHNGIVAARELGHTIYGYTLHRIALWSHQSAQTASSEQWIMQIKNVSLGNFPPKP